MSNIFFKRAFNVFHFQSYCLKVKEMDDEEYELMRMNESMPRIESGNYEYRYEQFSSGNNQVIIYDTFDTFVWFLFAYFSYVLLFLCQLIWLYLEIPIARLKTSFTSDYCTLIIHVYWYDDTDYERIP